MRLRARAITYSATLNPDDALDCGEAVATDSHDVRSGNSEARRSGLVAPDGTLLAFNSVNPITGYNNIPAEPQDCHNEDHREKTEHAQNSIKLGAEKG